MDPSGRTERHRRHERRGESDGGSSIDLNRVIHERHGKTRDHEKGRKEKVYKKKKKTKKSQPLRSSGGGGMDEEIIYDRPHHHNSRRYEDRDEDYIENDCSCERPHEGRCPRPSHRRRGTGARATSTVVIKGCRCGSDDDCDCPPGPAGPQGCFFFSLLFFFSLFFPFFYIM